MSGDIEVKNTSGRYFNNDEHIDQLEGGRNNNEEVTGNDRISVVAHERHPALLHVWGTFGCFGHVAPHRPWRNSDSDFQQQFIRDSLLAPSRIVESHFSDEF